MIWGKLVGVGIAGCLLGGLTGCGPRESNALAGMSVDDQGNPVIVLQDCEGVIQEIEIYDRSKTRSYPPTGPTPDFEYTNAHPKKAVVTIPLAGDNGWKPTSGSPSWEASGDYSIQIWGDRHEWRASGTEFTLADLKTLKPGQVRYFAPYQPTADNSPTPRPRSTGPEQPLVSPLAAFTPPECP
jgi:hypothetical protein